MNLLPMLAEICIKQVCSAIWHFVGKQLIGRGAFSTELASFCAKSFTFIKPDKGLHTTLGVVYHTSEHANQSSKPKTGTLIILYTLYMKFLDVCIDVL